MHRGRSMVQCAASQTTMATLAPRFLSGLRGVVASVAVVVAGFLPGGCATVGPERGSARVGGLAPTPVLVARGGELAAAEAQAARDSACFALIGAGRSMEPIYASGTAIVVREQSFGTLRPGLAVVYRNERGRYVAHVLVRELPGGWVVAGLNNAEPDTELVTRANFMGVIKAAYASAAALPDDLAARRAIRDGVDYGAKTAALK